MLLVERWMNIKSFNVNFNLICRTVANTAPFAPVGNESFWNARNLTPSLSNSINFIYHFTFVFLRLLVRLLSFIRSFERFSSSFKTRAKAFNKLLCLKRNRFDRNQNTLINATIYFFLLLEILFHSKKFKWRSFSNGFPFNRFFCQIPSYFKITHTLGAKKINIYPMGS